MCRQAFDAGAGSRNDDNLLYIKINSLSQHIFFSLAWKWLRSYGPCEGVCPCRGSVFYRPRHTSSVSIFRDNKSRRTLNLKAQKLNYWLQEEGGHLPDSPCRLFTADFYRPVHQTKQPYNAFDPRYFYLSNSYQAAHFKCKFQTT